MRLEIKWNWYFAASRIKSKLPITASRMRSALKIPGRGAASIMPTIFAPYPLNCAGKARAKGPLPAKNILDPGVTR